MYYTKVIRLFYFTYNFVKDDLLVKLIFYYNNYRSARYYIGYTFAITMYLGVELWYATPYYASSQYNAKRNFFEKF